MILQYYNDLAMWIAPSKYFKCLFKSVKISSSCRKPKGKCLSKNKQSIKYVFNYVICQIWEYTCA